MTTFWFDMDGTIAALYDVPGWLEYLKAESTYPYTAAKPLIDTKKFTEWIKRTQKNGHKICICSWASRHASADFFQRIAAAKKEWLRATFPEIEFDAIEILRYGMDKSSVVSADEDNVQILFDDDPLVRQLWDSNFRIAFAPEQFSEIFG